MNAFILNKLLDRGIETIFVNFSYIFLNVMMHSKCDLISKDISNRN